jgi:hypothetical protein
MENRASAIVTLRLRRMADCRRTVTSRDFDGGGIQKTALRVAFPLHVAKTHATFAGAPVCRWLAACLPFTEAGD